MKDSYFLASLQSHKDCHSEISSKLPTQAECSNRNYKMKYEEPVWKCRHVVVMMGFFVYCYVNGYRLNASVTLVAMVNGTALTEKATVESQSCPSLVTNITSKQPFREVEGEFDWSPKIQGYILSSYYILYVVGQIPAGLLVQRFGSKWFLCASSFTTGFCILMIPPLSRVSAWAVVAVNTVIGLAHGFVVPSISVMSANWYPKMERGLFNAVVLSGKPLGSVVASVFSGLLCEHVGWPSSFYAFGGTVIFFSVCIAMFMYESPNHHPRISKTERDFILANQECTLQQRRPNVPWKKILTSVPVWAVSITGFGQLWANSHFFIVHATYLGSILHYPIDQNGLFSALPFLLQFIVTQTSAFVSSYLQRKNMASVDTLRKMNTLFSAVGCSACFLGIYVAGCNRPLSILFGIVAMGFTGMGFAGCWITPIDMSPQFAGSLNGLVLTCACLSSVILPLVVGYLTDEMQTIEQWNKVMFTSMGVVSTTGIIFAIFGSAEVQSWNFVGEAESKNGNRTDRGDGEAEHEITRF